MPNSRGLAQLAVSLQKDQQELAEAKADPIAWLIEKAAESKSPLQSDAWIYRIVVLALGFAVILTLVAVTILTLKSAAVHDIFTAISAACVGALAGLLAPSPIGGEE